MGKYCGKCGSKLDERTGRCPRCDSGKGTGNKSVFLAVAIAVTVAAGLLHIRFWLDAPEKPEASGELRETTKVEQMQTTETPKAIPTAEIETEEQQVETVAIQQEPSADPALARVLINNTWTEDRDEKVDGLPFGAPVSYSIGEIVFLDSTENAPESSWDASAGRDGSVLGWAEPMGEHYRLYLAAEGGVIAPENCAYLFSGYGYLKNIAFNDAFHTEHTKSMEGMFYWSGLVSLDLSGLDTSSVTDMSGMFGSCRELKTLNIRNLDTACVTDMSGMFSDCRSLTKLDIRDLDTSKVTDMSGMFGYCYDLQTLDVSSLDTSSVQNMSSMFWRCANLTELDLRSFDTSSVTDMSFMFRECEQLKRLNLAGWDISNVTDMLCMFQLCESLESLDIRSWDLSAVENTTAMFSNCRKLDLLDYKLSADAAQQLLTLLEKHGDNSDYWLEGPLAAVILADFDRDGEDELLLHEIDSTAQGEQVICCRIYDYLDGTWTAVDRQMILGSYFNPGSYGYGGLTYIRETPALYTYEWKALNGTGGPGCVEEYTYTVYDEEYKPINIYGYTITWNENGEETRTYLMNGKKVSYEYFRAVACGYKGFDCEYAISPKDGQPCEYGNVVNSTLGRISPKLLMELLNTSR